MIYESTYFPDINTIKDGDIVYWLFYEWDDSSINLSKLIINKGRVYNNFFDSILYVFAEDGYSHTLEDGYVDVFLSHEECVNAIIKRFKDY